MEQNKNTYYAFYSNIAVQHNMLLASNSISGRDNVIYNIYTLADGTNRCIKCTAVYECEKYSNPDDVLKKDYKFPDAKFVGIVDQWRQSVYNS